ncbi:hypothetical protein HYW20_03400 [Candidatus Woesearchaeota archaeon]|nr:hypothetical protein [Candidatus Woesearchaeota archaeon]
MEVAHKLGILSIKKNVNDNVGFLLTNKKGSYCSLYGTPSSRYNGLFYFDDKTMWMYKFLDDIEVIGHGKVSGLANGFYFTERKKDSLIESFLMPTHLNSLVYELSSKNDVDIVLDCKESYDNRQWGRHYEIFDEQGCIIIKFTKKTDRREDASGDIQEFVLYLAVKSDVDGYVKNDRWVERRYSFDKERNSPPFMRYVYNALRCKGSKFIFSMSKNKNMAISECLHVFGNLEAIKNKEKEHFFSIIKNESAKRIIKNDRISNELKVAYINAFNSLNKLIVEDKDNYGVFAGLPWFFQFWSRDSLTSLKALSKINSKLAEKMLFSYLTRINSDGRLPNLIGKHPLIDLGSADAHGWLFLRCKDMAEKINRNKQIINSIKSSMNVIKQSKNTSPERIKEYIRKCSIVISKREDWHHKAVYEIESSLEKSINGLLRNHTKSNFEHNDVNETWMDTTFGDDKREGIRIEVQALKLQMYCLMFEITQNQKYKVMENVLKLQARQRFWNHKILADGLKDFTIRPNIFIAAYAYPELLSKEEWEVCFDNALKSLWLDWGGLSTIGKDSPLYCEDNTGEDIKSYHRGDSWFWINNLAALTLKRINENKFKNQIKKIIKASTEEILWKGCIGCHSEISSAKELSSKGCFNQAWSNAMFIELIEELFQ